MILSIHRKTGESLRRITDTLGFARSSFYHQSRETPTQVEDRRIAKVVREVFHAHRARYGYRRIHAELLDRGLRCDPGRVRRLMKQQELRAIQPRRFRPRTSDGKASAPSPNLLASENAIPRKPDEVWTGDITYIPSASGWLYLAVVVDLYSRKIVGWSLAKTMKTDLVCQAFKQALQKRNPEPGLIFHSDRGSQYGSRRFRRLLKAMEIRQSMSARANPYDNAWTESFIGTLKLENAPARNYTDHQQARAHLFEYIDGYYNTRRKHSALNYQTPTQCERDTLSLTQ